MSTAAQQVLDAFQKLTEGEQHEVASLILRAVSETDYGPVDDDTLVRIADEAFQEYDAREAAQDAD